LASELDERTAAQVDLELVHFDLGTEAELVEVQLEGRELTEALVSRVGARAARTERLGRPARSGTLRLGARRLELRAVPRDEQPHEVLAETRVEAAVPRCLGRAVEHAGASARALTVRPALHEPGVDEPVEVLTRRV